MKKMLLKILINLVPIKKLRHQLRIKYKMYKNFPIPKYVTCKIGRCTYFGKDCVCYNTNSEIGSFCSFADNVVIGMSDHPIHNLSTSPYLYRKNMYFQDELNVLEMKPNKVGNDVWMAHNVFVKEGVNIGDGAIVGAGAVVTKDVPPYAIVGGVPAKIIKYRFDEKTIEQLLELKWWDLTDEQIRSLDFFDIQKAIKQIKDIRGIKSDAES